MPFSVYYVNKKSKASLILDGHILALRKSAEGEYFAETSINSDEHELKIIEDNPLYHNAIYLQLVNPICFIRRALFMRRFMYLDSPNAEADVLVVKFRPKSDKQSMKIALMSKCEDNNYTKYYDYFELVEHKGVEVCKKTHCYPEKRFIVNYCLLNFLPAIITMLLLWVSIMNAFDVGLFTISVIYSIYAIVNILSEIQQIKKHL